MAMRQSTEARFRARVEALGGRIVGPCVNTKTPVDIICAAGHECAPSPGNVLAGKGICATCSGRNGSLARDAFLTRVAELGATALGPYVGANDPVSVRCANGHVNDVYPGNVRKGHHVCQRCAAQNPIAASEFRYRIESLGGRVIGPYKGSGVPVEVVCANGHTCRPRPNTVQKGGGICKACAWNWDAFYVVQNPDTGSIKFGVTFGDGRPRLRTHKRDGYSSVLLFRGSLPDAVALNTERACKSSLKASGIAPERGFEYFDQSALPIVMRVASRLQGL